MQGLKLQYRLMAFLTILIITLSLSISWILLERAGTVIKSEFIERANSITKNLAAKAELGVLIENKKILEDLADDLLKEKDVLYLKIYNKDLQQLVAKGSFDDLDENKYVVIKHDINVALKNISKDGEEGFDIILEKPAEKDLNQRYEKIGIVEAGFNTEGVNVTIFKIKFIMGFITSFFIILGITVAYIFSKSITRPISELVKATQKISKGDLTYEIKLKSKDEIGILANSFNAMTKDLKKNIEQLEKLTAQLELKVKERTSELEEANIKLQESNIKIKAADKMKTEFLTRMSHELRTPLNAILGFSGVILEGGEGEINKNIFEDIKIIENSGKHLLGLINNILDLSKIEAGKMELSKESINLKDLMTDITATADILAKGKDIKLLYDIEDNLPQIFADRTRIKQVILNLVSNAIKFTNKGTVTIRVRLHKDAEIVTSVTDTGIGLKEEDLKMVFNEFSQIMPIDGQKREGTGLGMAITKKLVELHDGKIWAESKVGRGTTFYFTLPLPRGAEKKTTNPDETIIPEYALQGPEITDIARGKKIAIVDDDPNIMMLYKKYLANAEYDIQGILDPTTAIDKIKDIKPDIIIVDIFMPKKSGWEIIMELKEYVEIKNIPIIICSIIDEKARGFALGARAYLTKPINPGELLEVIHKINRGLTKILIIDDNKDDVDLLDKILYDRGYNLNFAYSGKDGIDLIHRRFPDLIILDLMMPETDGFAVLENIKQEQKLKDIPVIVLTAKEITYEDTVKFENNVKAVFKKGTFTKEELVKNVLAILKSEFAAKH